MSRSLLRLASRGAIACVALITFARSAAASEATDAAKQLVAAQAKAMAGNLDTLVTTFTADALVFTPGDVLAGRDNIQDQLWGTFADAEKTVARATPKNIKVGALGDDAAWVTADVALKFSGSDPETGKPIKERPETLRITELVVRDGDAWRARAAHLSEAISDRDLIALIDERGTQDLTAIPDATDDADHAALLTSPAALAALLAADKATTVLGTSPKEKAVGAAKAKKLLLSWKSLKFTAAGGVRWTEGAGWAFAAANVETTLGKKHQPVTFRLLVLLRAAGDAWEVVSVHYSA